MVHDDDTGEPPHIGITDGDYPSGPGSAHLPSPAIQQRIISLAQAQRRGYSANTIRKQLEDEGHQVTVAEVRAVLAAANLDRR